ncbi:hypothetical protein B5F08_11690 [Anaeromassilibacillus sp. An172]|uniref:hypothetical protein n=1 Tax=Anaeromassilibacillus sp. An172 TaxID=1965570 RepID=UPI000B36BEC4|nr:hypothetical protein [Anaeromassilibacillus sp. An172]OUP74832.1 hypothetical protein B5F08_11690 [Anaeromassilibacillus sp. An172]
MINIKKLHELIDFENRIAQICEDYPMAEKDIWIPTLEALGDDEDEIIELMDNADETMLMLLWPVYEELLDKFHSEKMKSAVERFFVNVDTKIKKE